MPFYQLFWGEGSPTKIDYGKKGTLILTSLLEDLAIFGPLFSTRGGPTAKLTISHAAPPGLLRGGLLHELLCLRCTA